MEYFVYILECSDGTFYTGFTTDIENRLNDHNNSSKGAKYTRGRRPVKLIYKEVYSTEKEARHREYKIKQMTRSQKSRLIVGLQIANSTN